MFEEQDASGCWGANNLLETSFLLYAIAPSKGVPIPAIGIKVSWMVGFQLPAVNSNLPVSSNNGFGISYIPFERKTDSIP